jgi:DNA polymerase III subunit epsilon
VKTWLGTVARAVARLLVHAPTPYDFSYQDRISPERLAPYAGRALAQLDFVVLDTETTGLRPREGDRVVSLAAVRVSGGAVRRTEVFDALVRPGRTIPPTATRIHGITDAMVADAPDPEVVLPAFLDFAGEAVLVGHDIWFDLAFLEPDLARLGLPSLADHHPVLDTRLLAEVVHGPAHHDLDAVARRMGVAIAGRHSALGDALGAADILARLLAPLERRGFSTLGAALAASRGMRRGPADGQKNK